MTRRTAGALAAIVALAAAVRFWALSFGLPHTEARPDELAVIGTSVYFLRGNLTPGFFDYPWLQMWMVTSLDLLYFVIGRLVGRFHSYADFVASWPVRWVPFFLIARALTATLGTATTLAVFWIGRRLWDEATGLLAAFFLSLAYIHARDSHYATTDVPMTFLTVVAIAFLIDAYLKRRPPVAAAALSGLATATKYGGILLGLPLFFSYILHLRPARGRRARALVDAHFWGVGLAFLAAFAIGIPFVLTDNARFMDAMRALQDSMLKGQGVVPTEAGWLHHLRVSLRYGVGLPLLATGMLGAGGILAISPDLGLLLFSFSRCVHFVVAASVNNLFFRYVIPIVPFLCLGSAWLTMTLVDSVAITRRSRDARTAITMVVGLAIILPSAYSLWNADVILSRTDNRVVLARWFADHVPEGSTGRSERLDVRARTIRRATALQPLAVEQTERAFRAATIARRRGDPTG